MKKIIFLMLIFCLLFSVQAVEKVSRLGQHPFYKSRDLQPADLKIIALDKAGEVKMGFEEAGNGDLVFAFLEQIQSADVQTVELNPGDGLQWMLFKKGRKVQVKKDVVWDGKKPIVAYNFTIFRDGKLYEFIVPKICGNISLKNMTEVPAPVCALNVSPAEVVLGEAVKIDMCGSENAVKTTVTVTDAAGAVIKTMELTPENCSAELTLDNVGEYQVIAVVEGQYAMKSTNPCEAMVKVLEPAPVAAPIVSSEEIRDDQAAVLPDRRRPRTFKRHLYRYVLGQGRRVVQPRGRHAGYGLFRRRRHSGQGRSLEIFLHGQCTAEPACRTGLRGRRSGFQHQGTGWTQGRHRPGR